MIFVIDQNDANSGRLICENIGVDRFFFLSHCRSSRDSILLTGQSSKRNTWSSPTPDMICKLIFDYQILAF